MNTLMFYINATINAGAFLYSLFQNLKYQEYKNRYDLLEKELKEAKAEAEELKEDNMALIAYIRRTNERITCFEIDLAQKIKDNYGLKVQMKNFREQERVEQQKRDFFFSETARIVQDQKMKRLLAEEEAENVETDMERLERLNSILEQETQDQKVELIKLRCKLKSKKH